MTFVNTPSKQILSFEDEFFSYIQFHLCYSSNTVEAYHRDLQLYKKFLQTNQDPSHLLHFLEKQGLSARSQVRFMSCLKSYLRFAESKGESVDQLKHIQLPKIAKKLPKLTNFQEFQKLWQVVTVDELHLTLRNQLVLSLLYGLGCRVSELVGLNVKDFHQTEAWISIIGKGGRQRILPLSTEIFSSLLIYLKEAHPVKVKNKGLHLIFNNKGKRPSRVDIWRWLKKWSAQAGFDKVKNPHSFRHGCATTLLEEGADLSTIQKLLGHLNIQTTQIYTSVATTQIRKTVEDKHPLSEQKNQETRKNEAS